MLLSGEVRFIGRFFIIDYEYCWDRSDDDLHRESVKRPSDKKLSGIRLTLDEYEEINFLDDNDDPTSNTPFVVGECPENEEGPEEGPENDSEDLEDEDGMDGYWNQNYDEYNLW